MTKRKNPTKAELDALAKAQTQSQSEEKDEGADIASVEIKKSDSTAPVGTFNPKDNLRTVGNGVWRYILPEGEGIAKSMFETDLAKQYGIKKNDIVHIVSNGKVLTIGV